MFFFFQAEDGIRDLVRSRGLGDVYKRQIEDTFVNEKSSLNLDSINLVMTTTSATSVTTTTTPLHLSLIHI